MWAPWIMVINQQSMAEQVQHVCQSSAGGGLFLAYPVGLRSLWFRILHPTSVSDGVRSKGSSRRKEEASLVTISPKRQHHRHKHHIIQGSRDPS
jgi:hypothetical protein